MSAADRLLGVSGQVSALPMPTVDGAELLVHLTVWRTTDGVLVTATRRAPDTDRIEVAAELRDAADTIEADT